MSERENFLSRWSRRKRDAKQAEAHDADARRGTTDPSAAATAPPPAGDPRPEEFQHLPPIDSIGAETDIRAFLRPGVPAELKKAALRRAWRTDPAIRDFIGPSENAWDFTDPTAMGGFGPLERAAVERVLALAADANAAGPRSEEERVPLAGPQDTQLPAAADPHRAEGGRNDEDAHAQGDRPARDESPNAASPNASGPPIRRSRGRALPQE